MRNLTFIWAGLFLIISYAAEVITVNDDGGMWPSTFQAYQAHCLNRQRKGKNAYSEDWYGFSSASEKIKKIL